MNKSELLKHAERLGIDPAVVAPTTESPVPKRARTPRTDEDARAFAVCCARVMEENRCEQIVILDLRGISPVCDYFVIATGTSERQMRAVADHVRERGKEIGERPYRTSGYDEATWIVLDYVDVVVHVFNDHQRAYYDLDSLWGDSPHVPWEQSSR